MFLNFLFLIFAVHCGYNLERLFFVNELFALIGFGYFLKNLKRYCRFRIEKGLLWVNFILLYGIGYILISYFFLKQGTNYEFFRTTPVIYSIFSFFLGIEFIKNIHFFNTNASRNKLEYIIGALFVKSGNVITGPILLPLLFFKKHKFVLHLIIFIFIMGYSYRTSSTFLLLPLIFIFLLVILRKRRFQNIVLRKRFLIFLSIIFFTFIVIAGVILRDFYLFGWTLFDDRIDTNTIWRILLWSFQFNEHIIKHPFFGIGFGTKMFDFNDERAMMFLGMEDDPQLPYTLGTHNSYFFILLRLGIIGYFIVIFLYAYFFKQIRMYNFANNKLIVALFFSFIFISISALFHVVLESPIYAGIYWIITGMLYEGIQREKRIFFQE